jgi:acetyltransferase-like isoleucine patch superfamily enzyme
MSGRAPDKERRPKRTWLLGRFILKLKRGDTPFYRVVRDTAKALMRQRLPVPRVVFPFFRLLYSVHFGVIYALRFVLNYFYREPMVRSRCVSIGKQFHLALLPDISGHAQIRIGDNVNFYGKVGVTSGRIFDEPRLTIGNRVDIGHQVGFVVNKEIVIEDDVKIASGVIFMDTDSHPRDTEGRIANAPPAADEIKPIRICKKAWIGQHCFIMKGVTIGEGATIGVNSVVLNDIPPYSVALGNPARVIFKNTRPAAPEIASLERV